MQVSIRAGILTSSFAFALTAFASLVKILFRSSPVWYCLLSCFAPALRPLSAAVAALQMLSLSSSLGLLASMNCSCHCPAVSVGAAASRFRTTRCRDSSVSRVLRRTLGASPRLLFALLAKAAETAASLEFTLESREGTEGARIGRWLKGACAEGTYVAAAEREARREGERESRRKVDVLACRWERFLMMEARSDLEPGEGENEEEALD